MKTTLPDTVALVPVAGVKRGTKLMCDGGFTCMRAGTVKDVRRDYDGDLYIRCDSGRHLLDGQLDDAKQNYVGFWLCGPKS